MNASSRLFRFVRPVDLVRSAALAFGLAACLPALAQWAWKDDGGRTVFSDQPPPATVKKEQILRQPGGGVISSVAPSAPAPTATPAAGAKPAAPATPAAPKTVAEREQEFRKRQQERADADKKQAEEQALAARRRDECARARGYLRQLEDGVRIARTDAQGNREFLDDAQRSAEMARARESINANCN